MLSFVIPFYNEEKRLLSNNKLSDVINYLFSQFNSDFELIFVDDGSNDKTLDILSKTKENFNIAKIKVETYTPNKGKGNAVKQGVLASEGDKIIVMDADFSIDLNETHRFIKELESCDVVIGSKKHLLTQTKNKQKAPRRILGKGYTLITNFMLELNFTDITCGFKAFRSKAGKDIFRRQLINRWAYDSETLFIAKKLGYSIKELPVSWYHFEGSKVNPLIDTGKSFKDLVTILFNNYNGKYD